MNYRVTIKYNGTYHNVPIESEYLLAQKAEFRPAVNEYIEQNGINTGGNYSIEEAESVICADVVGSECKK